MTDNIAIIDFNNQAFRAFYTHKDEDLDVIERLAPMSMFSILKNIQKIHKAKIVIAHDSKTNWRIEYTKSEKAVTKQVYKSDRKKKRDAMTPVEKEKYETFLKSTQSTFEFFDKYTKIPCIQKDLLEADDIIAVFSKKFKNNNVIIISSDQDYIQLTDRPNTSMYDPSKKSFLTLEKWNNNKDWHMLLTCIRANQDGIISAYPRLRETKLKEAYESNDPFLMENILNHTFECKKTNATYKTKDLLDENFLLMDLEKIPSEYQILALNAIKESLNNNNTIKINKFSILKELKNLNVTNPSKVFQYNKSIFYNNYSL